MPLTRTTSGLLFADDFNRADGAPGANYTVLVGAPVISGNRLKFPSSGVQVTLAVAAVGNIKNSHVQVKVTKTTLNDYASVLTRANGTVLYLFDIGSSTDGADPNKTRIYRQLAGPAYTRLAGGYAPPGYGANVQVRYSATTQPGAQTLYIDGVAAGASADATAGIDVVGAIQLSNPQQGAPHADIFFDDLLICTNRTVTVTDVPTGWKIRCNGLTSAAAVNNTPLVLDLLGTLLPAPLLELLDPSGAVAESIAGPIYGGDVWATSINPHPLPAVPGTLRCDISAELAASFVDGTAVAPWDRSTFHRAPTAIGAFPAYKTAIFPTGQPSLRTVVGAAGFSIPRPVEDDWTLYAAVKNVAGNTTGGNPNAWYQSSSFLDCEKGGVGNDWGLNVRADGKLHVGVGNPDTSVVGTHPINDGLTHIISMTRTKATGRVKVWVDGVLDIDFVANTNTLNYPINFYFGRGESVGQTACDFGRVVLWDTAHSDANRGLVEVALYQQFVSTDWAIDKDALAVADLTSQFGFPIDAVGGGVTSQYALNSGGYLELPAPVDRNKRFLFAALIEFNGSAARASVKLEDPTDTNFKGLSVSMDSGDVRAESGTLAYFFLNPPPAGTRVWLGMAWDDTGQVCIFAHRLANGPLSSPDLYLDPTTFDHIRQVAKTVSGGAGEALGNLTRIRVDVSSTTSKVISVVARQGVISRGPAVLNPVVAGDVTPKLRVPAFLPAGSARNLVVVFHGANSSEDQGSDTQLTDGGVTVASLVAAGYLVATMRGTDDFSGTTYSGPKASNWGASASLITWWKAWIDRIKVLYNVDRVFFFGQSMGLVNALNMHALYPTLASAIAGNSGVANLSYAYTNEGFAALIDAAYGTVGLAAIQPFDPTLRANLYNLPIKLWHGDADATINYLQHAQAFAAAVNALFPGKAATVVVPGGTHLGASVYDGPALRAFYAGVGSTITQPVLSIAAFPTLASSAFASVPSGDTHRASQWQVTLATDPTFAAPLVDSGVDLVHLTALTLVLATLPKNVALIARVRHQGQGLIWSAWSASANIPAIQPAQPTCLGGFPQLTSSAYASYPASDGHVASQWQVTRATDAGYAAPVFDTGEDAVHLTSVEITSIIFFTPLIARVRHKSASGAWSPWSANLAIAAVQPWTRTDLDPDYIVPGGISLFDFGIGPNAGKTPDTVYHNVSKSVTVDRGDLYRSDTVTCFWPNYVVNGGAAPAAGPSWQGVVGTGGASAQPQSVTFDKPVRTVDVLFMEITFFGNTLICYDEGGVEIGRLVLDALWIGAHLGPYPLSAHALFDAGANKIKSITMVPDGDWIAYQGPIAGLEVPDRYGQWTPTDAAPDNVWNETDAPPATVWS